MTESLAALQILFSVSFATGALVSGVLYWLGIRFPGGRFWILAQLLVFVGATLDVLPSAAPWVLALANGTQVAGAWFFFRAIWAVRSRSRFPWWLHSILIPVFLTFGALAQSPYSHGSLAFALWMGAVALLNGLTLVWPGPTHRGTVQNWASVPFFVLSQGCFVRVGFLLPLVSSEHYDPTPLNLPYVGAAALLSFAYLFGYVALYHSQPSPGKSVSDRASPGGESPSTQQTVTRPTLTYLARRFDISPREGEVALLVVDGLTSSQIADRLFISTGTVKNHLKSLYRKTSSANRADFVRRLLQGE